VFAEVISKTNTPTDRKGKTEEILFLQALGSLQDDARHGQKTKTFF
jgi:hypothetical protein